MLNDWLLEDPLQSIVDLLNFLQQVGHQIHILHTSPVGLLLPSFVLDLEKHAFSLVDLPITIFIEFRVKVSHVLTEDQSDRLSDGPVTLSDEFADGWNAGDHLRNAME